MSGGHAARESIEAMKARVDLAALIRSYGVELIQDGRELRGLCPFHNEKTPSFTVDPEKQVFRCFGCDRDGAHVQFLQHWHQTDVAGAIRELERIAGGGTVSAPAPQREASSKKRATWLPLRVADREPTDREFRHYRLGQPVARWTYRGAAGELLGYVCRFEFQKPDGSTGKDVLPMVWAANQDTGECAWRWLSFEKPRPLYGLDRLAARPAAQVLIVEGEKTADAAQRLLPGVVVVSWPGGGKAVRFADWSPLQGRKVMIWPDRDAPGFATAEGWIDEARAVQQGIAQLLQGVAAVVKVIEPPAGEPDGWDLADAEAQGWDGAQVGAHIRANLRDPRAPAVSEDPGPVPPPANDNEPANQAPPDLADYDGGEPAMPPDEEEPFRLLGYGRGPVMYYMPARTRHVTSLSPSSHTKHNLMALAPLAYWEARYPQKNGVDWDMAANALIQRSQSVGLYDPDMVRGRGAWWDDGKPAIHLGHAVVLNGEEHDLHRVPSRFIYEASKALPVTMDDPLTNGEAVELYRICQMLSWEKPINARLLAGWIMLAPICGALRWRPHVWITGGAGSGKSTVMSEIVRRCLGRACLFVQSETSAAGVRQRLENDALPVVFDEAESETQRAAARIGDIMSLVTQASSETGAEIVKGSSGGKAMAFQVRSSFIFSSIAINIQQFAARTRISVLGLRAMPSTAETRAHYQAILRKIEETFSDEWVRRLHARAIRLIPVIRHNAEVFSEASSAVLGTKRLGDQVGTLLAGAFALHSTNEITPEQARAWVEQQDWSEEQEMQELSDERLCLSFLLESKQRLQGRSMTVDRSIGELIEIVLNRRIDPDVGSEDAHDALKRIGLKLSDQMDALLVSNTHKAMHDLLIDTSWANAWSRTLERLPGAKRHGPTRFAGSQSRAVELPIAVLFGQ